MSDQISFVCNELSKEESDAVSKVMAQTNYDEKTALIKLSECGFSVIQVLRDYMGIPEKKKERNVKSVNQEIFRQIRTKLDNTMKEYRETHPTDMDQIVRNFQESDQREKNRIKN